MLVVLFCTGNSQDFITKSINSHEDRITALESSRNVCSTCCACSSDIQTKYNQLKVEMREILDTVNDLKEEIYKLKNQKASSIENGQTSSSSDGLHNKTSTVTLSTTSEPTSLTPFTTTSATSFYTTIKHTTSTNQTPNIKTQTLSTSVATTISPATGLTTLSGKPLNCIYNPLN